jgi:RHS repeat-associated protein
LAYDGENRPVAITQNANTTYMVYGADGERVSKKFGTATHYYLGGAGEYLFNLTYTTGMLTSYIHPDVKREGTNIDILMKDHLNSNRVTIRYSLLTTRQDYGPYGQPVSYAGATLPQIGQPQTKGYINEKFDPETGLQYNHFRYMDPVLARFINPDTWDPILQGVDINRYAYAGNDPVNGSDANGHNRRTPRTSPNSSPWASWNNSLQNRQDRLVESIQRFNPYFRGPSRLESSEPNQVRRFQSLRNENRQLENQLRDLQDTTTCRPTPRTGGESPAAAIGRRKHRELAEQVKQKPGWKSEPPMRGANGDIYKPDIVTPRGYILELKPFSPSGIRAGVSQTKTYEEQLAMPSRVLYYDPLEYLE